MTVSEVLRSRWTWGGAAALALVGAFGAGRYMAPTKVEVRESVREVEVVRWRDREVVTKGPVKVVTRTVTTPGPAGPTVTVDRVVEREKVVTVHVQGKDTTTEVEKFSEKIVTRDAPRWTLGATVGTGIQGGTLQPPAWGGLAGYRLVGPLGVQVALEGNAVQFSGRAGLTLQF